MRSARRQFILAAAALAGAISARAQKPTPIIGYLGAETPQLFASRLAAFHAGLAQAQFAEGRNLVIEYRWAGGVNARLPDLAAELVRRRVLVIATPGSVAASLAARGATQDIPIVFEMGADPVALGLVSNMSHPGANVTGVSSLNAEVGPKRLQILSELVPKARSFALLVNPTNAQNAKLTSESMLEAARAAGLRLHVLNAGTEAEFAAVFDEMTRLRVGGLVVANDSFYAHRYAALASLAAKHSLPAIHQSREFVVAGGLVSYGGDVAESHRLAGLYTGRILHGEKPSDLPIQQVRKVEMYVNATAARALGIVVPSDLLMRANEVIA